MAGWWKKLVGDQGERLAARFLRRQGLRILARQCSNRFGEIDLIALDGDCIVFVEVKSRRSNAAGSPADAVTYNKQKRLTRTVLAWLKRRGLLEHPARFDVVTVHWPDDSRKPVVQHVRNAFPATGPSRMFS